MVSLRTMAPMGSLLVTHVVLRKLRMTCYAISFTLSMSSHHKSPDDASYHPLADTLCLYAGWLLSILFVVFAIGNYQLLRHLPFHSSLIDDWIKSPLILNVEVTTFVFMMLSSVHRAMGRGLWRGLVLIVFGFAILVAFRVNT